MLRCFSIVVVPPCHRTSGTGFFFHSILRFVQQIIVVLLTGNVHFRGYSGASGVPGCSSVNFSVTTVPILKTLYFLVERRLLPYLPVCISRDTVPSYKIRTNI
jgi:hypothetical protein